MLPTIRIHDMAESERPRERLMSLGADALKEEELIAILVRSGTRGVSALDASRLLLRKCGNSLDQLSRASLEDIQSIRGIGRDKAIALKAAFTLARRLVAEVRQEAPLLDSPDLVAGLLREENRQYEVECFQVVLVNTRRRLIRVERLSQGTLDSLLVHPREVFRAAIASGAAAVILVHNHPSGDPTPSEADIKVTRDLIRAGQVIRIEVLDHVILGKRTADRHCDYVSLRELGYFYS